MNKMKGWTSIWEVPRILLSSLCRGGNVNAHLAYTMTCGKQAMGKSAFLYSFLMIISRGMQKRVWVEKGLLLLVQSSTLSFQEFFINRLSSTEGYNPLWRSLLAHSEKNSHNWKNYHMMVFTGQQNHSMIRPPSLTLVKEFLMAEFL